MIQPVQKEMIQEAREAGLRYTHDGQPGISRRGKPGAFTYATPEGKKLNDRATLGRIKSLVIPPAWQKVWISPQANGHVQATGRDGRGRKQYRYHTHWRQQRDESKYGHMLGFARVLPKIRSRVARDLRGREMSREKMLATVVRLLETTMIRVGNEEYARENHSYGLTTMRNRHVKVKRADIRFSFRGKSGKHHEIELHDARLARIIRECQELPGQELFAYSENGEMHQIDSTDVNDYLRQITASDFTAKDFRTWTGTVLAATAFQELAAVTSQQEAKKNISTVIASVAKVLGNTPAVCRKCYVHPDVLSAYLEGDQVQLATQRIAKELPFSGHRLRPAEAAVLALLQRRLKAAARRQKKVPAIWRLGPNKSAVTVAGRRAHS